MSALCSGTGPEGCAHVSPLREHALQYSFKLCLITEVVLGAMNEDDRLPEVYQWIVPQLLLQSLTIRY